MTKEWIAFDTDRIKEYVFETGTLKEIRGASALLDRLNREVMPKVVGGEKIYANGGGGLFLVDENQASQAIHNVTNRYHQETHSASITGVTLKSQGDVDLQSEITRLGYTLRFNKDRCSEEVMPITHSFLRFCDSCGTRYSQVTFQGELLCSSCHRKRQEDEHVKENISQWTVAPDTANTNQLWGRLLEEFQKHNPRLLGHERPEDFNEIGALSRPQGYMGLIYADGDAMGRVIETISTRENMRKFSEAVDISIYQAVGEAAAKYMEPQIGNHIWPFDILLLGGDDLVMVTQAQSAIQVALSIVSRFSELTNDKWHTPLALSACVVLAHVKYPFGSMLSLAESGLKFAKKEAAKRRQKGSVTDGGLINFLVANSADHLDFRQHYNEVLQEKDSESNILYRTQRPYSTAELTSLISQIQQLKQAGVPRGRLEDLRSTVFKRRREGSMEGLMSVIRTQRKHRDPLFCLMGGDLKDRLTIPWKRRGDNWVSPILDVAELYDFI